MVATPPVRAGLKFDGGQRFMIMPTAESCPKAATHPAACRYPLLLRPATHDDEELLRQLYASTRLAELEDYGWDTRQQQAFLDLQFRAQREQYRFAYPSADNKIITMNNCPIGRLLVNRGVLEFRLIDITLLPEHRGACIGTLLIQELLTEATAAGKPVRLHVFRSNPAKRLYERLGFCNTGDDGTYLEMLWVP